MSRYDPPDLPDRDFMIGRFLIQPQEVMQFEQIIVKHSARYNPYGFFSDAVSINKLVAVVILHDGTTIKGPFSLPEPPEVNNATDIKPDRVP